MFRGHRFATPAVLMLVLALQAGCNEYEIDPTPGGILRIVRIQVPSLDFAPPDGIRLWRRIDGTNDYEPAIEILVSAPALESGAEFVSYTLLDPAGNPIDIPLSSEVVREGGQPELALWVLRFAPEGEFRASLFNEAGESGLSAEVVLL